MDAEICTACGRDIPINEPLTVRDGRVICAYCALAESDASAPAKPPHTPPLAKRKSKPPVALPHSSPRFRPFRQSPGPVAPLPVLWIGIYLTGLVAAIMVVNHAHNHDFGRMITRVSQGAIARAGPCQISVRQCILESLVMVSNGSAERIIVVVRVHNSSSSKAITYKTWRPQEAETGAPPQLGYHREGSRSWYSEFRTAFWGHPASGSVNRLLAANYSPIPGFTWRVCTVPPGGTVYDILQFAAQNTVTGPLTLSLPMSHLGQPGVVLCPIHPTVEFGFSPYKYAMRNRPVIGNFPLDQLAKVPPQTPVAPITDAVIPNLNHAGQSGGVTANVPSSGASHLTVTPANPATLFNQTGLKNAGRRPDLPTSSVMFWHATVDPPKKPLRIDARGHAVIPFHLQNVACCPQGSYLGGQTWFEGRFLHFYAINLQTGGARLALSTPAATVVQARMSPGSSFIAAVEQPYEPTSNGPNLPGSTKQIMALWSSSTGRMLWHESFARVCPYKLIGFAAKSRLVIESTDNRIVTRLYVLDNRSGKVARTWISKSVHQNTPLQISPGGKYLAAFSHGILRLWDITKGKLVGESRVTLPREFGSQTGRLAFSPGGSGIAAEISGYSFPQRVDYLLKWNARNGSLAAQAEFHPAYSEFERVPAAGSFGCLSGNGGWQIGLDMVDLESGRLYHRFPNPARGHRDVDYQNMLAWMPDTSQLVCAASAGSEWGYTVLHAGHSVLARELASVQKGESHDDWKLGPLKKANLKRCAEITLPNAIPAHWSVKINEPRISTTAVPARIIPTRLLTSQQGGPGHRLQFDSIHFAGAHSNIAIVAYRQFSVGGMSQPTAFWLDRIDLRSGAILGSFESPTPGAKILDLGADGKTMLLCTRDTVDVYRWPERGTAVKAVAWHVALKPMGNVPVNILYGRLLPADQAMTMTTRGTVVIWSVSGCRAECTFSALTYPEPVMDAARKLLAFAAIDGIYLINIGSGKLIGPLPGPPALVGPLAFSPDAGHLAMLVGEAQLAVWNLHRGKYMGRFSSPRQPPDKPGTRNSEIWRGAPLQWLGNRFLEMNGTVFDWPQRHAIWRLQTPTAYYSPSGITRSFDQRCWTLELAGNRWDLVGVRLPTPKMVKAAAVRGPKMPLKPGDAISVEVVPGNFLGLSGRYKQAAIRQLRLEGFRLGTQQNLVMTISCRASKPLSEEFGYGLFGNLHPFMLTATGRVINWVVEKSGKTLWSQSRQIGPTIPPFLSAAASKNPQQYVDRYNNRLFTEQVTSPNMPTHIFADTLTSANVSVIGPRGLATPNRPRWVALPGLRKAP